MLLREDPDGSPPSFGALFHERSLGDYAPYVGRSRLEELLALAEPLAGCRWTHLNSTYVGGGVAEILRSLVPLARALGIDCRWAVIEGHNGFFAVTKKFHNMLQGIEQPLSLDEIFDCYLGTIEENARRLELDADLVVVHDPQPAAIVAQGILPPRALWRCHIDTSAPNPILWRFLLPYINQFAGAIFTMPEFVAPGLRVPVYELSPCIDPLAEKNRPYLRSEALDVLAPLFHAHNVDPERPLVVAISRYDVHKNQSRILQAFLRLRAEGRLSPPPYLIFVGNSATDDPEGMQVYASLVDQVGDDPDVRLWLNVPDNDRVVGALMRLASVFVHVSTREGFGLVVSEALWQGTPVVGSRVGGIVKQVRDGETGFLVDPKNVDEIARRIGDLLADPDRARAMGERGREHVRTHFLLPELLRRYLLLLRHLLGIDPEPPPFRIAPA
ncbi:MAG: glycosyl transferase family 1 [Candidatus Binatia bacterium]|nr:MAG: glycosyl transferase family 1 [Candidatus Binatia bacterium]